MPQVAIKDMKQYAKAIEVLTRVGGTYRGVGQTEWFLLVTNAQYDALVEADVIRPKVNVREAHRGASSKKNGQA